MCQSLRRGAIITRIAAMKQNWKIKFFFTHAVKSEHVRIIQQKILDIRVQFYAAQPFFLDSNRLCYHFRFCHARMDGTESDKFRMKAAVFGNKMVNAWHLFGSSSNRTDKVMANAKAPAVFQQNVHRAHVPGINFIKVRNGVSCFFRNFLRKDVSVGIRNFIGLVNHGNASVDTK